MLIFGHLGITLGIAFILKQTIPSIRDNLDYRVIALGALLPDLIDKSIGRLLFPESIANGRLLGHTLLFVLILLIIGYFLLNRLGDSRIIQVAGASFLHLVGDLMWNDLYMLLWPAMGWRLPHGNPQGNFIDYLLNIISYSYIPELSLVFFAECVGFLIIAILFVRDIRK